MLPPRHTAEEFSLRIGFRRLGNGSYGTAAIPGYYLDAMFANEGEAAKIADSRLLSPAQLEAILTAVATALDNHEGSELAAYVDDLVAAGEAHLRARIAWLTKSIETSQAQLAKAQKAAQTAGIKLDNDRPSS